MFCLFKWISKCLLDIAITPECTISSGSEFQFNHSWKSIYSSDSPLKLHISAVFYCVFILCFYNGKDMKTEEHEFTS